MWYTVHHANGMRQCIGKFSMPLVWHAFPYFLPGTIISCPCAIIAVNRK